MSLQEQTPLKLLFWRACGVSQTSLMPFGEAGLYIQSAVPLQRVVDAPVVGETEAEAADKACLELCHQPRVKCGNPTSPQLPPAPSCLEELVPINSLSWGKKAEAGGFLALL